MTLWINKLLGQSKIDLYHDMSADENDYTTTVPGTF